VTTMMILDTTCLNSCNVPMRVKRPLYMKKQLHKKSSSGAMKAKIGL
jgi:hypothetical protein